VTGAKGGGSVIGVPSKFCNAFSVTRSRTYGGRSVGQKDLPARLRLFQDPDDLLFREPFPTHRRAFLATIAGGFLAAPLAAEAQQAKPLSAPQSRMIDHHRHGLPVT
jgi:hypothetical protein